MQLPFEEMCKYLKFQNHSVVYHSRDYKNQQCVNK